MSDMCWGGLGRSAAFRSNGCNVSPHSLDDDLAGHLRVNRAEVRISSCLAEREGKLLVRIEHFGLEDALWAHHCVWNVVAVGPRYRLAHRTVQRPPAQPELAFLHLSSSLLLLL